MILTIAQHEFLKSFKTGHLWKLLALCQFILGLIFYWLMEDFILKHQQQLLEHTNMPGITEAVVHPLFAWTALIFFFITPLLAVHSLTHERKTHTLELFIMAPLSSADIIVGKFLGAFLKQLFLLLPVLLMPLFITLHDKIDIGQFLSGVLGLVLLLSANLSLSFFIASLSKEPLLAMLVSIIVLFLFSLLEWSVDFLDPALHGLKEFALLYHCKNFLSGIIHTRDILYYGLFSFIFLFLSVQRLDKESQFKKNL